MDKNEIKMGIAEEMEHTDDVNFARKITMDHLKEYPNYYTMLAKMKKEMDENESSESEEVEESEEKDSDD
jgi:hypothetical protein